MVEGVWVFRVESLTIEQMKRLNAFEEAGSHWTIRDAEDGYEIRLSNKGRGVVTITVVSEENVVDARAWVHRPVERRPDEPAKKWRKRRDRARAFGHFRSRVEWAHPISRLASKLGIPEDDPRLSDAALALARDGRIVVYIDRNGHVADYGKPRQR